MSERRVVIMGAAGRDFHNFNMAYRDDPDTRVVAFTATQIPGIHGRRYPAELAGPSYPDGIPILEEDELEDLIRRERVDEVVFAYSDVSHMYVMHQASRVLADGPDFVLLGSDATMVQAEVPVVSVCAVRTGAGKSQTSRFLAGLLQAQGLRTVVIRHPMPYGDLVQQRVQRFASLEDLELHQATIEEREDYEPHIRAGLVVYAGVDYQAVVEEAQQEADVIIWDGGNNDFPFVRPDLEIVVVDPFRPGHEVAYHPGEVNLRRADVVVVNKVGSAPVENVTQVEKTIRETNPRAQIVRARSVISVDSEDGVRGRHVLVVEDGPTLTHGEMPTGAGAEAARVYGAAEIIDPHPYAVGEIARIYAKYDHLGPILPAVGYYPAQLEDLAATIAAVPAEVILSATPFDIGTLLKVEKPIVRVGYELEDLGGELTAAVHEFLEERGLLRDPGTTS
jgi:predicted GTPase